MIKGAVTRQGKYADGKDICELYISKASSNRLPHKYGKPEYVNIFIGNSIYKASIHETKKGVVWISSVLYEKDSRGRVRLVDALTEISAKKGDKIRIQLNEGGIFVLKKCSADEL
ncbi:MAG: hypothetical protein J7M29_11590 [Verrucomicrobia bacterium]|nr:hypothetical protein [Verrucomicrobiota bacterium]